jgi:hypothetical protein
MSSYITLDYSLVIDKAIVEAKITHKGPGRFRVLDDKYSRKYIGQIVDASDVISCSIDICDY